MRAGQSLIDLVSIHGELGIRCQVEVVSPGTLPRFEMKARRFNKTNV